MTLADGIGILAMRRRITQADVVGPGRTGTPPRTVEPANLVRKESPSPMLRHLDAGRNAAKPPERTGPGVYAVRLVHGPTQYELPQTFARHAKATRAAVRALGLARRLVGRPVAEARVIQYRPDSSAVTTVRYLSPLPRTGGKP